MKKLLIMFLFFFNSKNIDLITYENYLWLKGNRFQIKSKNNCSIFFNPLFMNKIRYEEK